MEIGSIKSNKGSKLKIFLVIGCLFIAFWLVILLCAGILIFTSGDNMQMLPDDYEGNSYNYENIDEPYWLSYPDELEDFEVDKDYLDYEGSELGSEFYREVMESDPEILINEP